MARSIDNHNLETCPCAGCEGRRKRAQGVALERVVYGIKVTPEAREALKKLGGARVREILSKEIGLQA